MIAILQIGAAVLDQMDPIECIFGRRAPRAEGAWSGRPLRLVAVAASAFGGPEWVIEIP
jgi:hypothetical protein